MVMMMMMMANGTIMKNEIWRQTIKMWFGRNMICPFEWNDHFILKFVVIYKSINIHCKNYLYHMNRECCKKKVANNEKEQLKKWNKRETDPHQHHHTLGKKHVKLCKKWNWKQNENSGYLAPHHLFFLRVQLNQMKISRRDKKKFKWWWWWWWEKKSFIFFSSVRLNKSLSRWSKMSQ